MRVRAHADDKTAMDRAAPNSMPCSARASPWLGQQARPGESWVANQLCRHEADKLLGADIASRTLVAKGWSCLRGR